ncbi:MAG: TetR/AcrR family transcriptional regulator [Gaiellaceae bacterium]
MPKVSPAHLEARRAQILDGARRCFARFGYEGATAARLEDEIGLSRGAIFHYFSSKSELFWALAELDQSRALEAFDERGIDEMLRVFVDADPAWLGVYAETMGILRRDPEAFARWQARNPEGQQRATQRLEELRRRGELRDDVPLEEIGRFLGIVADGIVLRRMFGLDLDAGVLLALVRSALAPRRQ